MTTPMIGRSMNRTTPRNPRQSAPRAAGPPAPRPPAAAVIAAAAGLLLLALAPAGSNAFWGVNPWNSLPPAARISALAAALLAGVIALRARGGGRIAAGIAILLGAVLAFPLRERIHFLGDTGARLGALAIRVLQPSQRTTAEIATAFHAMPLDTAVNAALPLALHGAGLQLEAAVSTVSFLLSLLFFAGAYRVASAFAERGDRMVLWLALILAGTLQAFAGYADSAGLLLAAAAWWWSRALRPVATTRDALVLGALWLVAFLSHRLGIALLAPLVVRAVGPPLTGDAPRARRTLGIAILVVAAMAAVATLAGGGGARIAADLREFAGSASHPLRHLAWPPDTLNLLAVIAPLAWLAPFGAGWLALRDALRAPRSLLLLAALLPLLPLALQVGSTGLGLHRDWDANALLGWTLSVAAIACLAAAPALRRRAALAVLLPVAALAALSWVMVNADEAACLRRANALAEGPPALAPSQQAQVLLYLSSWEESRGRYREAATLRERSWTLAPTSNRGLLAARAWLNAGDLASARRMLTAVRSRGGLDDRGRALADTLDQVLERAGR